MATPSGPIKQQLGLLKFNLKNQIIKAEESIKSCIPSEKLSFDDCIEVLQIRQTSVRTAADRIRQQLDAWTKVVQENPAEAEDFEKNLKENLTAVCGSDDTLSSLEGRITRLQRSKQSAIASAASATPVIKSPQQPKQSRAFKAPKMQLLTFSGDVMEFKQFWGIFEANIHKRDDMTNIEKFTYLLSQLKDDAKKAVAGIYISDETYEKAVQQLKTRFDRGNDRLVTMLYSKFMRINSCGTKFSEKQSTLDDCEQIFQQLETAGEDINSNKSLVCGLLSKFPPVLIRDLQRFYNVGSSSKLDDLREGLRKALSDEEATSGVIDDLQAMKFSETPKNRSPKDDMGTRVRGDNMGQGTSGFYYQGGTALGTVTEQPTMWGHNGRSVKFADQFVRPPTPPIQRAQMLSPPGSCYFCGGGHFNGECNKYFSVEDRKRRISDLGRCTRCLRFHNLRPQNCIVPIKCVHCRTAGFHISALCPQTFPRANDQTSTSVLQHASSSQAESSSNSETDPTPTGFCGITALSSSAVKPALFQTAKTTAINPKTGARCIVRLAMDTLSSRSYVREPIARKLGLFEGDAERLFISVFGSSKTVEVPTSRVEFQITLKDGSLVPMEANTTKIICQAGVVPQTWTSGEEAVLKAFLPSLADDPFDENTMIDVLVGANSVWDFIEGPRKSTSSPHLFLIPSKLGFMLSGESDHASWDSESTMACITETSCLNPVTIGLKTKDTNFVTTYPDIDEFWDLEKIGITDDPIESDDEKASGLFDKTVCYKDGRYQASLPWIEEKREKLPSNYEMAYNRFRGLAKRLKANPELLQGYRDVLKIQADRKIIERVSTADLETANTLHYLPHHAVVKPSSNTTKIRIVYDAAAKTSAKSVSLNECLFRGPVLLPDLCQLLMRMRTHEVVVCSDIEKAFLQVSLNPNDRDATRFLWFKDDSNLCLKDNVQVYRFTRVNFGMICSPFLLAATVSTHLTRENSAFAETLRNDIYVDNVISGVAPDDSPIDYYEDLKALFNRAGMNIQEFCSNSRLLMDYIPGIDKVKQTDVKVLGLRWDSQNDDSLRLVTPSKLSNCSLRPSKRTVLKALASVFDPLGFFQPILLPVKCFLQKLWRLKLDWEDGLSDDLKSEWSDLLSCLGSVFDHRIPRFVGTITVQCTLAVFCDASALAYATAVYLRCQVSETSFSCNLILAKSRLAPSDKKRKRSGGKVTLPRLELLGATIGARAGAFARSGLYMPDAHIDFFIDSQCVLHWIANRKGQLKRFVGNRVNQIRNVASCAYHYVPSADNPADFGTRGKLPEELLPSDLWWRGPPWLSQEREFWPKSSVDPISEATIAEIQSEVKPVTFSYSLLVTDVEPTKFLSLDLDAFSSFKRLIRVSVRCLKFLDLKVWHRLSTSSQDQRPSLKSIFGKISPGAIISSEEYAFVCSLWVKSIQEKHYPEVFEFLRSGVPTTDDPPQIVQQLGLQLDSCGLLRCHGRLQNADLPENARCPLLIPKADRFSILLVQDKHNGAMHSGVTHTLDQMRLEYWIPSGRALVRSVLKKCLICRRFKTARPFKLPAMPPWPVERVSPSHPFESTGLDYFGPVLVKVGEERMKMWVCLFTCLCTRAIHLEPVMDFSANEFLHCLIRFTSRRGVPTMIISDNASQFQLVKIMGDHAWKRTPTDDSVTGYSVEKGIKWKFITELAPWQGGFYERLVGLVKSTLRTSIRRKLLTWTDFITLLTEAEAVVNSRPLTYVTDDIESRFRIIRPCDFLTGLSTSTTASTNGAEVQAKDFGEAGKRLVSVWKQRCRTLDKLWQHWRDEYLLSLRERRTVSHKSNRSDVQKLPLVGQVVLIVDSDAPRGSWKMARITKLVVGSDGRIRAAEVNLSSEAQLRRALNHLVPLEVEDAYHGNVDEMDGVVDGQPSGRITGGEQDNRGGMDPQTPASAVDGSDLFYGFSQDDVQRTVDAFHRVDQI